MNMKFYRKLPIPQETKEWYPVTPEMAAVKRARDEAIRDIFTGQSDRFLLVIGPCSADKSESVLEYIGRLRRVADKVQEHQWRTPHHRDVKLGQKPEYPELCHSAERDQQSQRQCQQQGQQKDL